MQNVVIYHAQYCLMHRYILFFTGGSECLICRNEFDFIAVSVGKGASIAFWALHTTAAYWPFRSRCYVRRHSGIFDECKEFRCCIGYDGGNISVVAGGHYLDI